MARIILEMVIIFGALGIGAWYFSSRYIRAKNTQLILKEAYFEGGPLDQQTHKLKSLPNGYMFGDAVYQHNGGGVYVFQDYLNDGTPVVQGLEGWKS